MLQAYTVDQVSQAINYWKQHEQADALVIGPNARALADVLGTMLYERAQSIETERLTAAQIDALAVALHQLPLDLSPASTGNA